MLTGVPGSWRCSCETHDTCETARNFCVSSTVYQERSHARRTCRGKQHFVSLPRALTSMKCQPSPTQPNLTHRHKQYTRRSPRSAAREARRATHQSPAESMRHVSVHVDHAGTGSAFSAAVGANTYDSQTKPGPTKYPHVVLYDLPRRNRLPNNSFRETRVASPDQARAGVDVLSVARDGSAGTGTGSRPGTGELFFFVLSGAMYMLLLLLMLCWCAAVVVGGRVSSSLHKRLTRDEQSEAGKTS